MLLPNRTRLLYRPKRAGESGLTLLELVLVMTIFAALLGGGVGFFANLDLGRNQAAGLVRNVLRSARQTALARRAPARVRFDVEKGTLAIEALRVVGTWHFESQRITGALGVEGIHQRTRFDGMGWIGDALAFDGQPGAYAAFPVHRDPAYDAEHGFMVECAVRRDTGGGGRLFRIGEALEVLVNGRGAVRARFRSQPDRAALFAGGLGEGGSVLVESAPGLVPMDRWTRLVISYDRARFSIAVDGIPVAVVDSVVPVASIEDELMLSDPEHPFPGAIDALVISMVESIEPAALPDTVTFPKGTPAVIHFDVGGGLDRRHHTEPVVVPLELSDGALVEVVVGLFGTVE